MNDTILRIRDVATTELVPSRSARRVLAVLTFAIATALGAHVGIVLPITPVPITLQLVFVVLAGALLGPRLGAASQLVYLAAGIAGAPVFSNGGFGLAHLLGPTGGYLLAFPVAAWTAGALTGARTGSVAARVRGLAAGARLYAGLLVASFVVLAGGWAQLAAQTGDPGTAFALGVAPFLVGDLIKVTLAFLIAWRGRDRTLGLL